MAMTSAPTIHDVARASGVSISTVSRALGRPERVSSATRDVVVRAAAELGYQPSPQARSLLSGRSSTVMLLLPDVTNPFYFGLIRGVQREAAVSGYRQVVVDTEESVEIEAAQLLAARKSVDGVILAASRLPDEALARAASQVPLVAINRVVPGVRSVVIDTPGALRLAAAHLAGLGHRRLAHLPGPDASWSGSRRWDALADCAGPLGLQVVRLGTAAPTREGGVGAVGELVSSGATAVLAFNDLQAIGLLGGLAERGIAVPGQLSVVGCDDIFGADFCNPPLTTLSAPVQRAGRLATASLLAQLGTTAGEGGSKTGADPARDADGAPDAAPDELAAELVVRSSTGPAPTR